MFLQCRIFVTFSDRFFGWLAVHLLYFLLLLLPQTPFLRQQIEKQS